MERPAPVTLFGVLNIVFGVFAFYGVISTQAMEAMADPKNPVLKLMHENPNYATWVKITIPLGLLSGIALLAAGIGLLRQAEWARKLSIGYGIYGILFNIALGVVNYLFLFQPLLATDDRAGGAIAAGIVGVLQGVYGLAYPILLIFFMTRPKIAASFQPPAEPPGLPV